MDVGSNAGDAAGSFRVWRFGQAEFDEARRELRLRGQVCTVEAKPLAILYQLLARAGVVSKETLNAAVWPGVKDVGGSLTTAISKLRAALDDRDWTIIVAVRGEGYQLGVPVSVRLSPEQAGLHFAPKPGEPVPYRPQWRLERRLGGGANPDVWLARHVKTAEARVFKFADTPAQLQALRREVALSRLLRRALGERPEFVPISEWNFELRPYCIESPFAGLDLAGWLAARGGAGAMPLPGRLDLVARVARIVAAAHDVGVLHGDLKPGNILVEDGPDGAPMVRLVDFGSGRMTEAASLHAAQITGAPGLLTGAGDRDGEALGGTLRYLAPELLDGGPPTMAADVYALGVLLYQLVIADLDRALAGGWERAVDDPLLRQDIADATAGDPSRRLGSAALLAERLLGLGARHAAAAQQQAEQARLARLAEQVQRARLRRPWLGLAAVLLAAGSLGTGIAASRALKAEQRAAQEAAVAQAENSFLSDDLLARGDPARSGRPDETLIEAALHAEAAVDVRFASQPLIAARLHASLAAAFEARTAWQPARAAYERAIADYQRAEGEGSPAATILLLQRVNLETRSYEPGALARANSFLSKAEARLGTIGRLRPQAEIWLTFDRGLSAESTGSFEAAVPLLRRAADAAEASPAAFTQLQRFRFRAREAHALMRMGKTADAEAILDPLEQREVAVLGPLHAETLSTEEVRVETRVQSGRHREALELINRLSPAFMSVFGAGHRLSVMMLSLRGTVERVLGDYDAAIHDGYALHDVVVATQGTHAFYGFAALSDVALAQCRSGRAAEGVTTAMNAYKGVLDAAGAKTPWSQLVAETVAFCLITDHRGAAALSFLDQVKPDELAALLSDPVAAAEPQLMRADIAFSSGDLAGARSLLDRPRTAYAHYTIDPYYTSWTARLAAAVDAATEHPETVRLTTTAP